jgi:OPT family oligopeptide transporter
MAIQHLTDEQIRTWSLEQKDRWWFANVFRGDMPQLTFRSAATGFVLGAVLSATNLYIGAKTGWSLGVGLTSVILAFAAFRLLSRLGMRDMTILENNASQSVATAAGYMTGPLISGMAAYMWVSNAKLPWPQMLGFNIVLSILGVLVAFPLKRRFINDEQQPFPEGRAAGVVLDTLYTSDARHGLFQAKVLAIAAGFAGLVKFCQGESYQVYLQGRLLGHKTAYWLAENTGVWWERLTGKPYAPHAFGYNLATIEVRGAFDLSMIGAGGLMGVRPGLNMVLGMVINYVILVPLMIHAGEIAPQRFTAAGEAVFTRSWVLNSWGLWWGVAILVTSSVTGLFAKPQIIASAFRVFRKKDPAAAAREDVLKDIEFPFWISAVGIPIVGAVGVWMCAAWFGVVWWHAALAVPLICILTLIAVNSTALTSITPTGSLSKIPQFLFGLLRHDHPATNLMTATMCTEVASNASNLLMDIKPGYMLGAKPRQQAVAHIIGIFSGGIASTMLFYYLFLPHYDPGAGQTIEQVMSARFAFPGAVQWKGISDLLNGGFKHLPSSAVLSMEIAAAVGIVFEVLRIKTRNRFPISPLAIGLGVVIPPESTVAMCFGALFFWSMGKLFSRPEDRAGQGGGGAEHGRVEGQLGGAAPGRSLGHRLWVGAQEPICAGLIAGAALVGIGDLLIGNFVLE